MIDILITSILIVFFISLFFVFYTGIQKNYLYIFIFFVQFVYFFNTPVHRHRILDYEAINVNVEDYFPFGFFIILLHIIFFNILYFLTPYNKKYEFSTFQENEISIKKNIFNTYFILFTLIFVNTLIGGINLIDIITGKSSKTTLGFAGATYYIQNFADSLITLIVASFVYQLEKRKKIFILIPGLLLFIILGFRYRILLTVFAGTIYYIAKTGIKFKKLFNYIFLIIIFFYCLLFLTYNRVKLYSGQYDDLVFDAWQFNYDVIYDQAKGSLVDFAIYKAINNNTIDSDNGETMFKYVIIKMLPSSFFENNTKPYPPPQLQAIDKAINAPRDIGEASTALGSVYYAFSIVGVVIFSILLGITIKRLTLLNSPKYVLIRNIMVTMAIFQFLTRGYFPQFIDHLVYMIFPIFFFYKHETVNYL
jgi:oligosaccharide repeat unit polymerase